MQSEKPAPTEPADPECAGEGGKKAVKQKQRNKHAGAKTKKPKPSKKLEVVDSDSEATSEAISSSDDSDDDDDDESESEVELKRSKRLNRSDRRKSKKASKKKGKKRKEKADSSESESDDDLDVDEADEDDAIVDEPKHDKPKGQDGQEGKQEINLQQQQQQQLMQLILQGQAALAATPTGFAHPDPNHLQAALRSPFLQQIANAQLLQSTAAQAGRPEKQPPKQRSSTGNQRTRNGDGRKRGKNTEVEVEKVSVNGLEYKRVDQVWDSSIHNYKLKDTTQSSAGAKYEGFLFHIRRTFDWEGKYKTTYVDIKSKELRESIREVIGDIKGVSLVEETPKLDPNLLFLSVILGRVWSNLGTRN